MAPRNEAEIPHHIWQKVLTMAAVTTAPDEYFRVSTPASTFAMQPYRSVCHIWKQMIDVIARDWVMQRIEILGMPHHRKAWRDLIRIGKPDVVSYATELFDFMRETAWYGLCVASRCGNVECCRVLCAICTNEDKDDALRLACKHGHLLVAKALVYAGANVNSQKKCHDLWLYDAALDASFWIPYEQLRTAPRSPLSYASQGGHAHIVRFLLDANADVDDAALDLASFFGKKIVLSLLRTHRIRNLQNIRKLQ